jgi:hypothetical protein
LGQLRRRKRLIPSSIGVIGSSTVIVVDKEEEEERGSILVMVSLSNVILELFLLIAGEAGEE